MEDIAKRRVLGYWLVGGGLTIGYAMMRGSDWQGSAQLHTFMEGLATLLALMVGAMALVRFYSQKNNTFLFVGSGCTRRPFTSPARRCSASSTTSSISRRSKQGGWGLNRRISPCHRFSIASSN